MVLVTSQTIHGIRTNNQQRWKLKRTRPKVPAIVPVNKKIIEKLLEAEKEQVPLQLDHLEVVHMARDVLVRTPTPHPHDRNPLHSQRRHLVQSLILSTSQRPHQVHQLPSTSPNGPTII